VARDSKDPVKAEPQTSSNMPKPDLAKHEVDHELMRALAKLLDETGLTEIEFERGGQRVRVARHGPAAVAVAPVLRANMIEPTAVPPGSGTVDPSKHPGVVTSPMVGSAYRAAEPGAKPFVDIGSQVKVGDTLLIIEAMKTLNQIPAPRAGTVTQILFVDSQPVEFAEPMMIIE